MKKGRKVMKKSLKRMKVVGKVYKGDEKGLERD